MNGVNRHEPIPSGQALCVRARRIALIAIALQAAGIAADAAPLMWIALALGVVGLCAFIAALCGGAR